MELVIKKMLTDENWFHVRKKNDEIGINNFVDFGLTVHFLNETNQSQKKQKKISLTL